MSTEIDEERPPRPPEGVVSLAAARFEDLRALGMSVTQAQRVLRYGDERGITHPDELDQVPGFTSSFLAGIKRQLVP